jgi:hypothetical protein
MSVDFKFEIFKDYIRVWSPAKRNAADEAERQMLF